MFRDKVTSALQRLENQFGKFDNVKLSVRSGNIDTIADELLMIAEDIESGKFRAQANLCESALEGIVIK